MNNDIVVEMKTEKANEEAGLLNKRPSTEQVRLSAHCQFLNNVLFGLVRAAETTALEKINKPLQNCYYQFL